MYYVIYENSRIRHVSSSKDSYEECEAFIKRAGELDRARGESYVYHITKVMLEPDRQK